MECLATFAAFAFLMILSPAYSAARCSSSTQYITVYSGSPQVITSPNYPSSYPASTCMWRFHAASYGYRLQLNFTSFDVYESTPCSSIIDYLDVYDSSFISSSANRIAKLCGRSLPPILTSSGTYMYLKFSGGYFSTNKGFKLTVTAVSKPECSSLMLAASTSISKNITSPNYPYYYPPSTTCQWTITSPFGYVVQISFKKLNIYGYDNYGSCSSSYDNLYIYDSSYASSNTLRGQYCENDLPANVVSRQRNLLLKFTSGSEFDSKTGFVIQYKAVKDPPENYTSCLPSNSDFTNDDIKLKASSSYQYIQSPYYPNKYPSNIQCTWIISASSSEKKVKLTVTDVKIYSYYSYSCSSSGDSLTVRDGNSSSNGSYKQLTMLKQFCSKSDSSSTMTSRGQTMWIRFKTNSNNYFNGMTQAGFKMKFIDYEFEKEESSSNVGMIVGIIIGVIVFIGLIVCCVYATQRRRSRGHVQSNAAATSVQATTTTTTYQPLPPAPAPHYPLQQVGPPPGGMHQPPGGGYPPQTGVYPPPTMTYLPPGGSYPQQPQGSYPPPASGYPQYPSSNIPNIHLPQYPGPPAYLAQVNQAYNPQQQGVPPNPPNLQPQGVQLAAGYPPPQDTKSSALPQC